MKRTIAALLFLGATAAPAFAQPASPAFVRGFGGVTFMSEMREHQQLMRHMAWADAEVWRAVLALPAARADASTKERLHHVHQVQWAYLQIWREEPLAMRDLASFADLAAVHAWGREYHDAASAYLDAIEEPAAWAREVRFPWADELVARFGPAQPATVSESLLQIALHSTYHRGQVNARLRELGGEPPLVDFIAWIWQGRPPAVWTAA